jgi:hypothetical protein
VEFHVGLINLEALMIARRNLVGSGALAGAAALLGTAGTAEPASAPAAAAQADTAAGFERLARAVNALTAIVERGLLDVSPELTRIREQQRIFLKANQKFPDFVEVGIDVWENVYDWHVRHQQPITATQTPNGRYVMTVMFTTLILRPEQTASYIGFGFDAR